MGKLGRRGTCVSWAVGRGRDDEKGEGDNKKHGKGEELGVRGACPNALKQQGVARASGSWGGGTGWDRERGEASGRTTALRPRGR